MGGTVPGAFLFLFFIFIFIFLSRPFLSFLTSFSSEIDCLFTFYIVLVRMREIERQRDRIK